jgi:hypothetical protein
LAFGGLVSSGTAHATTMVELSVDQMVSSADFIVRGTVQEIWTERSASGHVWTRIHLDVSQVYKGAPDLDSIIVDQLGGEWAGQNLGVHGAARYDVGEEVVVFLEDLKSGHVVTVGMQQGKFTLKMDPVSREPVAFVTPMGPEREYDHRFVPLPSPENRVTLTDFVGQVSESVERGWDGTPIPGITSEELQRRSPSLKGVK